VISVVLVDDHAVVRSGIRLLLDGQDDIEVVGEAGNAKDALFRARALKPDVILLDVVMPGESGIEVLPKLLKESPETKILVLSMQDDPSYVREAFAAGAMATSSRKPSTRSRLGRPGDCPGRPLRPSGPRRPHDHG
jgi:two-component system response regulator NreC